MTAPDDVVSRAKAALEGVTVGPWTWEGDSFDDQPNLCPHGTQWTDHGPDLMAGADRNDSVITSGGYDASSLGVKTADAGFIAAARTLIPELIAEVEKLRMAEVERMRVTP